MEIQFTKGGLRDRFNRNEDSKSLESFDDRIYSGRSKFSKLLFIRSFNVGGCRKCTIKIKVQLNASSDRIVIRGCLCIYEKFKLKFKNVCRYV